MLEYLGGTFSVRGRGLLQYPPKDDMDEMDDSVQLNPSPEQIATSRHSISPQNHRDVDGTASGADECGRSLRFQEMRTWWSMMSKISFIFETRAPPIPLFSSGSAPLNQHFRGMPHLHPIFLHQQAGKCTRIEPTELATIEATMHGISRFWRNSKREREIDR